MSRRCSVESCDGKHKARGLCRLHYERLCKYGSTDNPAPTSEELFWAKVDKTPLCWVWRGTVHRAGYGKITRRGKTILAHRYSYELTNGAIPDGLQIDHLCRHRDCVNPDHLEAVTPQVNQQRGMAPGGIAFQTGCCLQGHPYTPENTRFSKSGRVCMACQRDYARLAPKKTVFCEACSKPVSKNNITRHRRALHSEATP